MKICFRSDASNQIGTGHIMRCLTLANYLKVSGHYCCFLSRQLPQSLRNLIVRAGHECFFLDGSSKDTDYTGDKLHHSCWLKVSQEQDAVETMQHLGRDLFDWVVVDHYALDAEWEIKIRCASKRLMVIDDLADRAHVCDILLDQNVGRKEEEYNYLLNKEAIRLIGPQYAILKPEFSACRSESIIRRKNEMSIKKILVTMGGVDQNNLTSDILNLFGSSCFSDDLELMVVMGAEAPWITQVKMCADHLKQRVNLFTGVSDMANLMKECDLAIGAAGITALERCCLGLPSLIFVLAENQLSAANSLSKMGACIIIQDMKHLEDALEHILQIKDNNDLLTSLINSSSLLVDGRGAARVCNYLLH